MHVHCFFDVLVAVAVVVAKAPYLMRSVGMRSIENVRWRK